MEINYQETTSDLLRRIDIHNQFGGRNIDAWMVETLQLEPGIKILDVACGGGKQCVSFYNTLKGDCEITGCDVNEELLLQAKKENERLGNPFTIMAGDFNKPLPFPDNSFDLVSCCFAIYYATDIPFTIREMHRVLKSGGRLFTTGPMPQNKQTFYDVIREATGKAIPPMPGSSRYSTEIYRAIEETFAKAQIMIFENPLTFESAQPFVDYTRASLNEDRKLWTSMFNGKEEFEKMMDNIQTVAEMRIAKCGNLVMTKVVGGFIGTK